MRGLHVFGNYNNGGDAGVGYRNFNNAPANSNNNTSSRSAPSMIGTRHLV